LKRDELQAQFAAAQKDQDAANQEIALLSQQLHRKERKCERLNDRIQAIQRQVVAAETLRREAVVKSEQKAEQVVLQNKAMVSRMDELEAEACFLKQAKSRSETVSAELKAEYERQIRKLALNLAEFQSVFTQRSQIYQARIADLEKSCEAAHQECRQSERRLEAVQREVSSQQARQQTAEQKVKAQADLIAELKRENAELNRFKQ
jgi:predicted  nucleic acid-binding Zn-ribbon protein